MIQDGLYKVGTEITPSIFLTAAAGLLMLLGFLKFTSKSSEDVLPGVPQFKGAPIFGVLPMYLKHGMPQLLSKLIAVGGDGISYINIFNKVLLSVHDPAMVREVLSWPDEITTREGDPGVTRWSPFQTLRRLVGSSLFVTVGPKTSHLRNSYIREFSSTKSNSEKFNTISELVTTHVNALTGEDSIGEVGDFRSVSENFGIALWGEMLYGNPGLHVDGLVSDLSNTMLKLVSDPWSSIWHSLQVFLRLVTPGETTRSEGKVRARLVKIIQSNIGKLEDYERKNPDAPLKAIRSLSIMTGGERTGPLSQSAYELLGINLFGGHHSIGINMPWALIELKRHPKCLAKLMDEINSVDITDFTQVNSKMPYLHAVIMEISRLYTIVHATLRVVNRDTTLTSGKKPVFLKRGMLVYLSYLHLHKSTECWGPDAGEFVPERFLDGNHKGKPFFAFGYGTRSCVGYQLTILATKLYLATLLQVYQVDVKVYDHETKIGTLYEAAKPVTVQLTRRS